MTGCLKNVKNQRVNKRSFILNIIYLRLISKSTSHKFIKLNLGSFK